MRYHALFIIVFCLLHCLNAATDGVKPVEPKKHSDKPDTMRKSVASKMIDLISDGYVIDFNDKKKFPEGNIVIGWKLAQILTVDLPKSAGPVQIKNAKVVGVVPLAGRTLQSFLIFEKCTFSENIDLALSQIEGGVWFVNCEIAKIVGSGAKIKSSFRLERCIVQNIDLENAECTSSIQLFECQISDPNASLIFIGSRILGGFDMRNCKCKSGLNLSESNVSQNVDLSRTKFEGAVTCSQAKIGASLNIDDCSFSSGLNLSGCVVEGFLLARNVRFPFKNSEAEFGALSVGRSIQLINASFHGDLNVMEIRVGQDLDLTGSSFHKPTTFAGAEVNGAINCNDAEFFDSASFNAISTGGNLNFERTHLSKCELPLFVSSAKIGGNCILDDIVSHRGIKLSGCKITGLLNAQNLICLGKNSTFDLSIAEIAGHVTIHGSLFQGPVEMMYVSIGGMLGLLDTQLQYNPSTRTPRLSEVPSQDIELCMNATLASVGGGMIFQNVTFCGRALFADCKTKRGLLGNNVVSCGNRGFFNMNTAENEGDCVISNSFFQNPFTAQSLLNLTGKFELTDSIMVGDVELSRLTVGRLLNLRNSTFYGERVSLHHAEISDNFACVDTKMHGANIDMRGVSVGGSALFRLAKFSSNHGSIDFTGMKIKGDMEWLGAEFGPALNCSDIEVAGSIRAGRWTQADGKDLTLTIKRGLTLSGGRIGGDIQLDSSHFLQESNDAVSTVTLNANNSVIGGSFDLSSSTVMIPLLLNDANVSKLTLVSAKLLGGVRRQTSSMRALGFACKNDFDATNTEWGSDCDLTDLQVSGSVSFSHAKFLSPGHTMTLARSKIFRELDFSEFDLVKAELDLAGATVAELKVNLETLPKNEGLFLRNFECSRLSINGSESTRSAQGAESEISVLSAAIFDTTGYANAAKRLREAGRVDFANEVLIAGKRRERATLPWLIRFFDWLLEYTSGYMLKPERLLYCSLFFILFGSVVFNRSIAAMECHPATESERFPLNSFWYSFYLFLPFDNIHMVDLWMPDRASRSYIFVLFYRYAHQALGWILVTLAVGGLVARFNA